ncbi:hypothetical protein [Clostridium sp. DL1XJH146]
MNRIRTIDFKILLVPLIIMIIFGNFTVYLLAYIFADTYQIAKAALTGGLKRHRAYLILNYGMLMAFQIVVQIAMLSPMYVGIWHIVLAKICTGVLLIAPFIVEKYMIVNKNATVIMPNIRQVGVASYKDLAKLKTALNKDSIEDLIDNVSRTSIAQYTNKDSLTENYFELCDKSLQRDDEGQIRYNQKVYIIVSDTGSSTSNLVSIFTKKKYNHASIAFDRELNTIVSYNGGEKIFPPGLNHEMIEYFNKKEGAAIAVYSLDVTKEQKIKMIDYIKEINETGSAYNTLGLVTKHSFKDNMMFCSQFVYSVLKIGGATYFNKKAIDVIPTDFVEKDYERVLNFEYKIEF